MNFIGIMRDFIKRFDGFGGKYVGIGQLNSRKNCVYIRDFGKTEVMRYYVDGTKILKRRFAAEFETGAGLGSESELETAELCEAFAEWLEEQSRIGSLPQFYGKPAIGVYLSDVEVTMHKGTQKYTLICNVEYMKGR